MDVTTVLGELRRWIEAEEADVDRRRERSSSLGREMHNGRYVELQSLRRLVDDLQERYEAEAAEA